MYTLDTKLHYIRISYSICFFPRKTVLCFLRNCLAIHGYFIVYRLVQNLLWNWRKVIWLAVIWKYQLGWEERIWKPKREKMFFVIWNRSDRIWRLIQQIFPITLPSLIHQFIYEIAYVGNSRSIWTKMKMRRGLIELKGRIELELLWGPTPLFKASLQPIVASLKESCLQARGRGWEGNKVILKILKCFITKMIWRKNVGTNWFV